MCHHVANENIGQVMKSGLLQQLSEKGKYKNLSLTLTDDSEVVKKQLIGFQDMAKAHPEAFNLY